MNDFVSTQNARPGVYGEVIRDIAQKRVCPFCPDQLHRFHNNPVERREHWLVTDNMYPYEPSRHHVLVIHIKHVEHIADVSREAWLELADIVKTETAARGMSGGTLVWRFGDTRFTGASVTHLHANLVQSDPNASSYDASTGLRVRVG